MLSGVVYVGLVFLAVLAFAGYVVEYRYFYRVYVGLRGEAVEVVAAAVGAGVVSYRVAVYC